MVKYKASMKLEPRIRVGFSRGVAEYYEYVTL